MRKTTYAIISLLLLYLVGAIIMTVCRMNCMTVQ